jgi:hypothetical protein
MQGLIANMRKLLGAIEMFHKGAAVADQQRDLRQEFQAVSRSWELVVQDLRKLPPGQNAHLLRAAAQIETLHNRLADLLGIKGDQPQLVVPT